MLHHGAPLAYPITKIPNGKFPFHPLELHHSVQTLMPIMLDHVNAGKLSLNQLINFVCENPVKIFGIKNKGFIKEKYDADFTIVDMNKKIVIKNDKIESKCKWSPFNDFEFKGTPVATIIAGKIKMKDGKILGEADGTPLIFN